MGTFEELDSIGLLDNVKKNENIEARSLNSQHFNMPHLLEGASKTIKAPITQVSTIFTYLEFYRKVHIVLFI